MRDFTDDLADVARRVNDADQYLRIEASRKRVAELEAAASDPALWDDPERARKVTSELSAVRDDVDLIDALEHRVSDVQTLFELGREEGDDSVEAEIESEIDALRTTLDRLEPRSLFSRDHDQRDAARAVPSC